MLSRVARMRATVSGPLPADDGTSSRIGRSGYAALATPAIAARKNRAAQYLSKRWIAGGLMNARASAALRIISTAAQGNQTVFLIHHIDIDDRYGLTGAAHA